jgi:hypothetical protein
VSKLQRVQNEAVKVISGTFRTTPREPLHQLFTILPMDLRLDMLIQNTALRLYRAPRGSQLLLRLGGLWHTPGPNDFSLPAPNRGRATTTLHALAARVPVNGPRVDPFPEIPQGGPSWNGTVKIKPKDRNLDYEQVTNDLAGACLEGAIVKIYCNAIYSNKNREDGKQLGAAAATLYHEGREFGHCEEVFGETITEADAYIRALAPGLDTLTLFLNTRSTLTEATIFFLFRSDPVLKKSLDTSSHEEQEASVDHIRRLGEILTSYPHIKLRLQWLPKTTPFIGFRRSRQLALEAIHTTDLTGLQEPQTIKSQKKATKDAAVRAWAVKWYEAPRTSLAYRRYRTALLEPPDGRAHHTFHAPFPAPSQGGLAEPRQPPFPNAERAADPSEAKFSRATYSTFYRLITGHAFTGEYTQWFYAPHTPEQIACPCGEPIQSVEHVLTACPIYDAGTSVPTAAPVRFRNFSLARSESKRCFFSWRRQGPVRSQG